mgnify:FL=1
MSKVAHCRVIEKISDSDTSSVFRGVRVADDMPVILKVQRIQFPSAKKIYGLKYEYEVIRSLEGCPGVIKAYGLERFENSHALILEDFGGNSLTRLLYETELTFEEKLSLAMDLTRCISQIHSAGIIHGKLEPANIIVNSHTNEIKIVDFSTASKAIYGENPFRLSSLLEGAISYMSPEQTGRLNLGVDYRSDYYSLGVILYQIFTGRLPFESDDPLELVHCHIAIKPVPPSTVIVKIPEPVSEIILKLMEKNPDSRYQSAPGILFDLEFCRDQLLSRGEVGSFRIGSRDVPEKLAISSRIYGRRDETAQILAAFDRSRAGSKELIIVSGRAGVGKTSLVDGSKGIIRSRHGYFVSGKFDQLHRDILDNAVLLSFREIVNQLLSEDEETVAGWKKDFLNALGPNCQVIIDIIPELEMIVGPQPAVLKLEPKESENRFKIEFQNFLSVFCRSEHPITIFLDDIQWADIFSLKLLEFMLFDPDTRFLLVIVSFREEEVDKSHPFVTTLNTLRGHDIPIKTINLQPLSRDTTGVLVADTLRTGPDSVRDLTELIYQRTQGNPFFLKEFLKSIYDERIIEFDQSSGLWKWESSGVASRDVTRNVAALLEDRIGKLPSSCRGLLKLAACMGARFDLESLAWGSGDLPSVVAYKLAPAVDQGLIHPLDDGHRLAEMGFVDESKNVRVEYKFAHDRIQQTSYSLIPDGEKGLWHKRLGNGILSHVPKDAFEGRMFDIVTHLNLASQQDDPLENRLQLAEFNLKAGRKARESIAYEIALSHFRIGAEVLGDRGWDNNYGLMLDLLTEATTVSFLAARFDEMNEFAAQVVKHARNVLDSVNVYEVRIQAHIAQNRRLEAVRTALPVLRLLGERFPDRPGKINVISQMLMTKLILWRKDLEHLSELPGMTDPRKLAAMRIFRSVISAAYTVAPEVFAIMIFRMVRISVRYGLARESALAFAAYAMVMVALINDVDSCSKIGDLAMKMAMNPYCAGDRTRVTFVFYSFIKTRTQATRDGLEGLIQNYRLGLELGDFEYAAVSAAFYCTHSYGAGKELPDLEKEVSKLARAIGRMRQDTTRFLVEVYHQEILNMMEPSEDPCLLRGDACDEAIMLPSLTEAGENSILCAIHVQKLRLCYLFRDYLTAIHNYEMARNYLEGAKGSMLAPIIMFYGSLARLAVFDELDHNKRKEVMKEVLRNQRDLKRWASSAPMNFLHKFHLVEAERLRVLKRTHEAMDHFDLSITMAKENHYVNEQALAYEKAAMFLISLGNLNRARYYLEEAINCYVIWGAGAKVKDLVDNYSELVGMSPPAFRSSPDIHLGEVKGQDLDLTAVIRASQSISAEIVFEKLLKKLMNIVIQIGGAEKGLLLMESGGSLTVQAEAFSVPTHELERHPEGNDADNVFSSAIVNYVSRTKRPLILDDAANDHIFSNDRYIKYRSPKSVCCIPVMSGGQLTGILYMENNQAKGAFTSGRLEMLNVLATQAATSIQNATLYRNLDESARRYESLFQNAQEAIFITDQHKLKFCNPRTVELTGYSLEELIDKDITDIIFPDDLDKFAGAQSASLASSSGPATSSFRIVRRDQSILWTQNNCVFMPWEGRPAILNFLTDITRIKLAGDLHARTERLKAVGELASGVAHNFNNLLQVLLGGVEISLIDLDASRIDKTRHSLEQMRNFIKLGADTVKRLQSFAGIRSSNLTRNPKVFDLSQTVSQACDITRPLWKTNLEKDDLSVNVKLDLTAGCLISGIESEFFEVLVNLIKNAVEAMPQGGTISCSTKILDENVILEIQDTGSGIPESELPRMFEPFWSTKGASGTGLGLSVSRQIISDHEGSISVKSQVGYGTCFTVRLPLVKLGSIEVDSPKTQPVGHHLKILVIDDSRPIVMLLEDLFTAHGQTVLGACSGAEGLELFGNNDVDMVICDIGMPDMSGWEVGRRIVSICNQTSKSKPPFVLLTGWGGQLFESNKLKESGVDGVMEKPVDTKRLFELLNQFTGVASSS